MVGKSLLEMYGVDGIPVIIGDTVGNITDPDTGGVIFHAPGKLDPLMDLVGASVGPDGVHPEKDHDFADLTASYGQRKNGQIVETKPKL